ncbi:MAG TPA: hypothetical protein VGH74_22420, partial [Planctomycetaceae bacterium]
MTTTEPVPQESSSTPRVQLNPTVDPEQARPVPTIRPDPSSQTLPPAAEPEAQPEPNEAPPDRGPSATFVEPREKVEIPSKGTALDVDLEAEINDALAGVGSLALGDIPGEAAAQTSTIDISAPAGDLELAPGTKVKGKVLSVHGDSVIVDLGTRASGVVPSRHFPEGKLPALGDVLDVIVEKYEPAEGLIELMPAKAAVSKPAGDWNAVAEGQIVDCNVTKVNKGGLE